MSKIAPTLQASTHYIPGRAGTRATAEAELRALLAVVRAAKKVDVHMPGPCDECPGCSLDRALARLSRAGRGRGK